jgi:hypothetical protein
MKARNRKSKKNRPPARKKEENRGSAPAGPEIYCTECGATLENFCFSSAAGDLGAVRKTLAQCRKQGRFSGDFCSKLFIAHPEASAGPGGETDEDPGP